METVSSSCSKNLTLPSSIELPPCTVPKGSSCRRKVKFTEDCDDDIVNRNGLLLRSTLRSSD